MTGLLVGLVWLGWVIAIDATALNQRLPGDVLRWRPALPSALVALAEDGILTATTDDDLKSIEALARRALNDGPLEARALRLLGLISDIRGQSEQSLALVGLAADRARRDALSQIWLLERDLQVADLPSAVDRIDAIMRARPDLGRTILPSIAALASQPVGGDALVRTLANDQPWRGWLFRELPAVAEPSTAYSLLAALKTSPVPPRAEEINPSINRMIALDQFDLAYLAWVSFLPTQERSALPYMYNGSFELPTDGNPFNWSLQTTQGAVTEIVGSGEEARGNALRVTFANTRVRYRHARKLFVLPPGQYAFSGTQRAQDIVNERGLAWRMRCASDGNRTLAESPTLIGTMPWESFAVEFTVPSDCGAQWLTLELLARIASEEQVGGEAWYDDFRIERMISPAS